jgi:general secretion pathway protein A
MYESHFHLNQTPFSIAPDPAFLYLSDAHQEALAHLMYGFSHGGFVLITGEVGTGKTTLLRNLVKQIPEDLDVAFILNPRLTVRELLETLCDELGVEYPKAVSVSVKMYIDALNRHLLAAHAEGRGTVVIIDEAQNLSPAVLEQIRLLTNLETDKRKLLRIILLGQPELGELLSRTELRQLAQRITARYHLRGLSREDTYSYVIHRLARAGGSSRIFTRPALRRLYAISKGIPRVVNLVADRALLGAYVLGRNRVTAGVVERAAGEVLGRTPYRRRWIAAGVVAAAVTSAASAYFLVPAALGPGVRVRIWRGAVALRRL